ncbi:hypothetical protein BN946_scf185016.g72 [Trametes cinnabarina]|uniref:Carrier domain-containing protein n=1 Tax=Pycnoporus cinnabarinus TaxID=5643 RepID=A0A060SHP9_PYCCI|nr:hypothetical protein BN946_scf185016.g72 [Trametes cinnabarina]
MLATSSGSEGSMFPQRSQSDRLAPSTDIPTRFPPHSVAVVGMAVDFPGATSTDGLWNILRDGLNTVQKVPAHRFDVHTFTEASEDTARSMPISKGNFVQDPDAFDNAFFHISPREARSMDPQQRVLLRTAYHALEDAGYTPGATPAFDSETFATFVGVATEDYVHNLRDNIDVYYSTGTLRAFLSGRISYAFGFEGPSIVLDTACSSSMVAFHQACRALMAGDCNAALAGGVNIITSPDMYRGLARGHFLSNAGQCRPWDASADGYCRAEGCGLFVLKRLEDAITENDRIHAVIRGVEVNQSGQARSITHPHIPAQVALFEKLVSSADVHPHDVNVVECHGTGTQAGDPAELEAVRKVFAVDRAQDNPLHITSIKANIGHAEAASGAASLAKLILMIRERTVPRHISYQRLNPRIPDLAIDNVRIDTTAVPWDRRGDKRLALLTNFGAAGSNGAMIVQEYAVPHRQSAVQQVMVVGLSCKTAAAAEQRRRDMLSRLEVNADDAVSLQDFAYSATARRQLHEYRLAVSGSGKEALLTALRPARVVRVRPANQVVFVFSGQGSHCMGMGGDFYRHIPLFTRIVDECHSQLVANGDPGILTVFQRATESASSPFDSMRFRTTQAALFVLEYALARVWMSWGVEPSAVVGHSFGEFAALTIAGVLSLHDALRMVARRAEIISVRCEPLKTGMTSVRSPPDKLVPMLGRHSFAHLEVCCYNSPSNFVVGGALDELQAFEELCVSQDVRCTRLDVPFAYHSAAMAPALLELQALSGSLVVLPPNIPVLSNVTGTLIEPGDVSAFSPDYFVRHCREPARFQQGIASLASQFDISSTAAIIEVGPHPTTVPLLRTLQADGAPLLLPSLRKGSEGMETMCAALAQLYCTDAPVKWRKVFEDLAPGARVVDLPAYPFAKTRFWVPYEDGPPGRANGPADSKATATGGPAARPCFSLLDRCVPSSRESEHTVVAFETDVESLAELIQGHQVAEVPLCPASVYAELALAAGMTVSEARSSSGAENVLELADIVFSKPFVYIPERQGRLRIHLTFPEAHGKYWCTFSIRPFDESRAKSIVYCKGSLKKTTQEKLLSKFSYSETMVKRDLRTHLEPRSADSTLETFRTRTVYDLLFPSIVSYSETYRTIKSISVNASTSGAYAVIQLSAAILSQPFATIHPVFVDTLFHVAGFLVNFMCAMNGTDAYICSSVDRLQLIPDAIDCKAQHGVYATVVKVEDSQGAPSVKRGEVVVVDVYAIEVDGPRERIVARMKRVRFQKVSLDAFKEALRRAAGTPSARAEVARVADTALATEAPEDRDGQLLRTGDILNVVAETTGIPCDDLTLDARLTHLGIDSLMLWEVATRLTPLGPARAGQRGLEARDLAEAATLGDLVALVRDTLGKRTSLDETSAENSFTTLCEDIPSRADIASPVPTEERRCLQPIDIQAVRNVLSSVLDTPVDEISNTTELGHLGLDSLTSIEAKNALRARLNVEVDQEALFGCRTVQDVYALVAQDWVVEAAGSREVKENREQPGEARSVHEQAGILSPPFVVSCPGGFHLVRLQSAQKDGVAKRPLILIHDGSGSVASYARLAPLGRDVWAIRNRNLLEHLLGVGARYEDLVPFLAGSYAKVLANLVERCICSEGYYLGGWSFGGVVAFELVKQLERLGVPVKGLILIDAPAPQTQSPLPDWLINNLVTRILGPSSSTRAAHTDDVQVEWKQAEELAIQMRVSTRALVAYNPELRDMPTTRPTGVRVFYLRATDAVDEEMLSASGGEELPERVRAFLTKRGDDWTMSQWAKALGAPNVEVAEVPGDHFSMFDYANTQNLSGHVQEAIRVWSEEKAPSA